MRTIFFKKPEAAQSAKCLNLLKKFVGNPEFKQFEELGNQAAAKKIKLEITIPKLKGQLLEDSLEIKISDASVKKHGNSLTGNLFNNTAASFTKDEKIIIKPEEKYFSKISEAFDKVSGRQKGIVIP